MTSLFKIFPNLKEYLKASYFQLVLLESNTLFEDFRSRGFSDKFFFSADRWFEQVSVLAFGFAVAVDQNKFWILVLQRAQHA